MEIKKLEYIANYTGGKIYKSDVPDICLKKISIDSRSVDSESLFFAIIGNRVDAHDFLEDVIEKECLTFVLSNKDIAKKICENYKVNIILVDDTLEALMKFTEGLMHEFSDAKIIGVTGSVGKTAAKEMISAILSDDYKVEKTKGNFNSEYGIPLMVSRFKADSQALVIEMGVGDTTKMDHLADMIKPNMAVITKIGSSHLETFGSREKILEEKLKIIKHFKENDVLVVNGDDNLLNKTNINKFTNNKFQIKTVGFNADNDYQITDIKDCGIFGVSSLIIDKKSNERFVLKMPYIGEHNLINGAIALAIGKELGVDLFTGIERINNASITSGRLEVLKNSRDVSIINDTYNASPESVIAALKVLAKSGKNRKIAILGDMLALGENSELLHEHVGESEYIKEIAILITIGRKARAIGDAARKKYKNLQIFSYDTKEKAIDDIIKIVSDGDLILVKASRGMELEEIVEKLLNCKEMK